MAELDDQTLTDLGSEEAVQTPLDSILEGNATDAPAAQSDEGELGGRDAPRVPLTALKRERERRQRADKQVEEMRAELERFDNAKYGFDGTLAEEDQRLAEEERQRVDEASQNPAVTHWKRSEDRHKAEEDKINAGIRRMSPEQWRQAQEFVRTHASDHPDPVGAIRDYVDQLGLLDFKGQPIDQILTKDKQPQGQQATDPRLAEYVAQLNEYGQAVSKAEQRANFSASKADFVSEYGKAAYNQIDQLSVELAHSGHPVAQQFLQAVQTSSDPVTTAAQLLHQLGVWNGQGQQQPQQQQPARTAFPSNLANRRNMGQRNGPAYGGPTPLNDIFKH